MDINTQLAYAAGYIDGDGCFHIRKQQSKFVNHFIITSTNRNVLAWFKKTFGGTISSAKKNQPKKHKPLYQFSIKKKIGIPFTESIIPYLIEKIEEAKVFIDFANSKSIDERILLISKMNILKNSTNLVSKNMKIEFESLRKTIDPSQEDFSYLAGFIDAECCLGIQRYRSKNKPNFIYKIQLQCNNTKAPVFKWLLQRFGGQIHFIDRNTKDITQRNQLTWRLSSAALANILSEIYPFLKYKKPVCEELMKFYKTTLPNGGARHTDEFRGDYARAIEDRENIVRKVHLLNLKGI